MAYAVKITDSALSDAEEYVRFLQEKTREPETPERWFRRLVAAIYSLEDMPQRCPVIPEAAEFAGEFKVQLRHLIFRSHRIIFRIDEQTSQVTVLRVYHGARRKLWTKGIQ